LSFAAMTETSLGVDKDLIDMTGKTTTFKIAGASMDGTATNNKLSLTVDGVTYSNATGVAITTATTMKNLFVGSDFKDSDGNLFSAKFTAALSNGNADIDFTSVDNRDLGATLVLAKVSGTDNLTAGTSTRTQTGGYGTSEIDAALATVASERATLGATQAQLESTVRNLANVAENTSAAAGRIMDTDYAAETANLTKAQILQQAATSVLAQANAQPQSVLSLLQ
jgi:flagellin